MLVGSSMVVAAERLDCALEDDSSTEAETPPYCLGTYVAALMVERPRLPDRMAATT